MAQVLHTYCYRSCNRHSGASDMICYKLICLSGCRSDYGDLGETLDLQSIGSMFRYQ